MGREATKAAGNPWYEARKRAAEYDDRLSSREGAAESLGMSVSALADAELGLTKCMPVDKAVLMSDRYNAPQLLNYYCLSRFSTTTSSGLGRMRFCPGWKSLTSSRRRPPPASIFRSRAAW